MPSSDRKKKVTAGAAVAVTGLLVAGIAAYKGSRDSSGKRSRQHPLPLTQTEPNFLRDASASTGFKDKANTSEHTEEIAQNDGERAQETTQDHRSEDTLVSNSDSTRGLWRDEESGCWRSQENNCPQIRNGRSFGDPVQTGDMQEAYETVMKDWGLNPYA